MKSTLWIAIILIFSGGAAYLGYEYGLRSNSESATTSEQSGPLVETPTIRGQGRLQPANGTISIMAQPGERIDKTLVHVGDDIEIDQPLAILASQKVRQLEFDLATTRQTEALKQADFQNSANQFKVTAAEIATLEASSAKSQVTNKSNAIGPLETNLETAKRMLEKLKSMRDNPVTADLVGQNEIDKQQALVEGIQVQITQAKGDISIGNDAADRAVTLAENQRELAEYNLKHSKDLVPTGSLALAIQVAQMALDATTLKSPIKGQVIDITIFDGDTVTNRPLMLLADTSKMICVAEISDSQLGDVRTGEKVELTSDALATPLHGTVIEIGTMIGPPSMVDPNPFAVVDRKTGKVKIQLSAEDSKIAAKFVNLQVEVKIDKTEKPSS